MTSPANIRTDADLLNQTAHEYLRAQVEADALTEQERRKLGTKFRQLIDKIKRFTFDLDKLAKGTP